MQVQFLGQGYEPITENAVGNYLIKFFADEDFYSLWVFRHFQAKLESMAWVNTF